MSVPPRYESVSQCCNVIMNSPLNPIGVKVYEYELYSVD